MIEIIDSYVLQTFVIPSIALFIPVIIFLYRKFKYNLKFVIQKRVGVKFLSVWLVISFLIYSLLIYLTGGINSYFYLEKGFFYDDRSISWNVTEHINITIPYDPGVSLLVVALLSGLLYASLLTLPAICTILNTSQHPKSNSASGKTASLSSSMSAAASAFSSTAVCCSTSVIAVVAPSIGVLLGPFVPGLLIGSFLLLIYSFYKVVMPRFPVIVDH